VESIQLGNLLGKQPVALPHELIEVLLADRHIRIERIVSEGHASPEGFWYDQSEHEWVLVLTGAAELRTEDQTLSLRPGDFAFIPAHKKHRVERTSADQPTVWLAIFWHAE
jgi:cupin 2 domain-containing protein